MSGSDPPSCQSRLIGVACWRYVCPCFVLGVGQIGEASFVNWADRTASGIPAPSLPCLSRSADRRLSHWSGSSPSLNSPAEGVGHASSPPEEEDPLAAVGRPDVGRPKTSPCNIVPEGVQVGENLGELPSSVGTEKPRDVFAQEPSRLCLPKNSRDVRPQPSFVG